MPDDRADAQERRWAKVAAIFREAAPGCDGDAAAAALRDRVGLVRVIDRATEEQGKLRPKIAKLRKHLERTIDALRKVYDGGWTFFVDPPRPDDLEALLARAAAVDELLARPGQPQKELPRSVAKSCAKAYLEATGKPPPPGRPNAECVREPYHKLVLEVFEIEGLSDWPRRAEEAASASNGS